MSKPSESGREDYEKLLAKLEQLEQRTEGAELLRRLAAARADAATARANAERADAQARLDVANAARAERFDVGQKAQVLVGALRAGNAAELDAALRAARATKNALEVQVAAANAARKYELATLIGSLEALITKHAP